MICYSCNKPIDPTKLHEAFNDDESHPDAIQYLHTDCMEKIQQDEAKFIDRLTAAIDPYGEDDDYYEYVDYHEDLWED
jgi:hypothetical protein